MFSTCLGNKTSDHWFSEFSERKCGIYEENSEYCSESSTFNQGRVSEHFWSKNEIKFYNF